jgi:hypothetical protein
MSRREAHAAWIHPPIGDPAFATGFPNRPAMTERLAVNVNAPSLAARMARAPRPPEELADASHERVHQESGKTRPGKSVRTEGSA